MNTALILIVQYNAQAIIPIDKVVKDYFPHLSTDKFVRKVAVGDINIPIIRIEPGTQKSARGVHIADLVRYIEGRHEVAIKEAKQLTGTRI
ncbi:pyocin activator PrtN family protein [Roseateles toxinivorans]|uniref:Pyocin activator protein PrtN n=1 Tax=Roseateles toxinivorans TaxID=270368 RepID=A0A4R6QTE7_9BURK|nr:pyocin activator PrtN family protein [Roseateles toxinivorans]TDP74657.1 pyocin activator protein PrtN [Roseateles toxinivorans]